MLKLGPLGPFGPWTLSRDELRDATRLALQSAVAAGLCFSLMRWFELNERFVGVLSAVLVVGPSVGSTLAAAQQRLVATVVGSLIGVAAMFAMPGSVGTAVALAGSLFVINWVAGIKPGWRYGSVAAIALALGSDHDLTETAIERCAAIGIGVAIGSLVTFLVWRDKAEDRAQRHLRAALAATADRLRGAINATGVSPSGPEASKKAAPDEARRKDADDARDRYHRAIGNARSAASDIRLSDDTARISAQIEAAERLYNSVLIVNRVANKTDDLGGEDEDFKQALDRAREHACEITRRLAEDADASQDDGNLDELRDATASIREHIGGEDGQSREHLLRVALLFGLDQVEDSLAELIDAQSGREAEADDALSDTGSA